jgi:hypothetical protein
MKSSKTLLESQSVTKSNLFENIDNDDKNENLSTITHFLSFFEPSKSSRSAEDVERNPESPHSSMKKPVRNQPKHKSYTNR